MVNECTCTGGIRLRDGSDIDVMRAQFRCRRGWAAVSASDGLDAARSWVLIPGEPCRCARGVWGGYEGAELCLCCTNSPRSSQLR